MTCPGELPAHAGWEPVQRRRSPHQHRCAPVVSRQHLLLGTRAVRKHWNSHHRCGGVSLARRGPNGQEGGRQVRRACGFSPPDSGAPAPGGLPPCSRLVSYPHAFASNPAPGCILRPLGPRPSAAAGRARTHSRERRSRRSRRRITLRALAVDQHPETRWWAKNQGSRGRMVWATIKS